MDQFGYDPKTPKTHQATERACVKRLWTVAKELAPALRNALEVALDTTVVHALCLQLGLAVTDCLAGLNAQEIINMFNSLPVPEGARKILLYGESTTHASDSCLLQMLEKQQAEHDKLTLAEADLEATKARLEEDVRMAKSAVDYTPTFDPSSPAWKDIRTMSTKKLILARNARAKFDQENCSEAQTRLRQSALDDVTRKISATTMVMMGLLPQRAR